MGEVQDFPKPSSPKGRKVSNKSETSTRIIYSFHDIWSTMLVIQLFDLKAGVELGEVWNVPEECEDDHRHHIDCARQTGEPGINSGRYLSQIFEMADPLNGIDLGEFKMRRASCSLGSS